MLQLNLIPIEDVKPGYEYLIREYGQCLFLALARDSAGWFLADDRECEWSPDAIEVYEIIDNKEVPDAAPE
jgi:hypothetical protein